MLESADLARLPSDRSRKWEIPVYIRTLLATIAAGALGPTEAPFAMGGALLVPSLALLAAFKMLQRRAPAA